MCDTYTGNIILGIQTENKTASFQKEAMRT